MRILKRDGSVEAFDLDKIKRSILVAIHSSGSTVPNIEPLVDKVAGCLPNDDPLLASEIGLCVENRLMDAGWHDAARSYIVKRDAAASAKILSPDSSAIADYIVAAKYSRGGEDWTGVVDRCRNMHLAKYPEHANLIGRAFSYVYRREVLPSMRSLQFGGDAILRDNARMYNCSFTHADRVSVFSEIFYLLLCGCGVGYSVQIPHIAKLPLVRKITQSVLHYQIPDTIIGWAEAVRILMESYFYTGQYVEYDYSLIRSEGSPLITSGGKAPGHLPLKRLLETLRIHMDQAIGRQLRTIEVHDAICYIAQAVLSGGIRRSSLISLFTATDTLMLYAKAAGQFDPVTGLNNQRAMANNSGVLLRDADDYESYQTLMKVSIEGYGDPGFYFTNNIDYGCNPCGEIGMYPVVDGASGFSFCNLTEINCATVERAADFLERCWAASVIGTVQAGYDDIPYLGDTTRKILQRDALLGVSLTGMVDCPIDIFNPNLQYEGARKVTDTNKYVASIIGINPAARSTTIKPSGTASLVLGCVGSGIHPHHSSRYFRRVTANRLEDAASVFAATNPHMVTEMPNGDLSLCFPVETKKETISSDWRTFLNSVCVTYDNWVLPGSNTGDLTHNVSCTLAVPDGEMHKVIEEVWERRYLLCAMTFVPFDLDARYPFAPRETVGDNQLSQWNNLIENYVPVSYGVTVPNVGSACEGPLCEIPNHNTQATSVLD